MNTSADTSDRALWGMGDAIAGWVLALVGSSLAVGAWMGATGDTTVGLGALAAGQAGLWAGLLGAPLLASRRKGNGNLAADFGLGVERGDASGFAVGVACQVLVIPLLYLVIQLFTGHLDVAGPARELTDRADGAALIVLGLLVVFVAPVIEELFYRGLLLRAAARRWGSSAAVVVSSTVFAASHFQLVVFPGLFVFGVVLAVLTVRSDRLGAAIAAHVGFHAVTIVALAVSR